MNDKAINNSLYGDATRDLASIAKDLIQNCQRKIKQGMDEIESLNQNKQTKRRQVYLHSIGRMTNLRKLQLGLRD